MNKELVEEIEHQRNNEELKNLSNEPGIPLVKARKSILRQDNFPITSPHIDQTISNLIAILILINKNSFIILLF